VKKSAARVVAREQGEKFYVPENSCAKGHALRRVSDGTCVECKKEAERIRVAADRKKYNDRKKQERKGKLYALAEKMRVARANESTEQRTVRLEKAKIKQRVWRKNNPKHAGMQAAKKLYKQKNPGKVRADTVKRRATKIQRTPVWLTQDDHWMVEQAYELAALRAKLFGFSWHVDHIIPLQGKLVSGLHTPYNLQVIPGTENVRKANKFEVT
jgi:hypothetical protein